MSEVKFSCIRCGRHTFNQDGICDYCRRVESIEALIDKMKGAAV